MAARRRVAMALGLGVAVVSMVLAVTGAIAPQLALIGAVAVCGAVSVVGRSPVAHP